MLRTDPQLPRYNAFNIYDSTYKTVKDHPLQLSVLIPKKLKNQKHPVLVRFHGGGLVEGVRLGDWFRPYILDYCAEHSVVVVSPDYRFLPESTGRDILDDVRDFWHWIEHDLNRELHSLQPDLIVDLGKIVVTGESAGGYLAVQSLVTPELVQPNVVVRAILLQSPILDLDLLKTPAKGPIFDLPTYEAARPKELLRSAGPGTIVSSHEPDMGLRFEAAISMLQHGTFVDALHGRLGDPSGQPPAPDDDAFWPIRNLDKIHQRVGSSAPVPALWIVAGWHDCMAPPEGAVRFCSAYKRLFKSASVCLSLSDGDHGFDSDWTNDLPEVARGWAFVKQHWLC